MKKPTKIFFTIIMLMIILISRESFAQSANWSWAKQIGGTTNDQGNSTAPDTSGNVYTTGAFSGTVDFDPGAGTFNLTSAGNFDIFISKLEQKSGISMIIIIDPCKHNFYV